MKDPMRDPPLGHLWTSGLCCASTAGHSVYEQVPFICYQAIGQGHMFAGVCCVQSGRDWLVARKISARMKQCFVLRKITVDFSILCSSDDRDDTKFETENEEQNDLLAAIGHRG